jgi:preprotein translocase subunit YajC
MEISNEMIFFILIAIFFMFMMNEKHNEKNEKHNEKNEKHNANNEMNKEHFYGYCLNGKRRWYC